MDEVTITIDELTVARILKWDNMRRNGHETDTLQDAYHLRRGRVLIKEVSPETKYETLTFKHFFLKLLAI